MRKELKAAAPGYLCGWRVSVCVFRLRLSRCASQNTCQRCEPRQSFVLVVWRGLFGLDNGQQVLLVLIEYVEDYADGKSSPVPNFDCHRQFSYSVTVMTTSARSPHMR